MSFLEYSLLIIFSLLFSFIPILLMEIIYLRRENKELRQTIGYFKVEEDSDLQLNEDEEKKSEEKTIVPGM